METIRGCLHRAALDNSLGTKESAGHHFWPCGKRRWPRSFVANFRRRSNRLLSSATVRRYVRLWSFSRSAHSEDDDDDDIYSAALCVIVPRQCRRILPEFCSFRTGYAMMCRTRVPITGPGRRHVRKRRTRIYGGRARDNYARGIPSLIIAYGLI